MSALYCYWFDYVNRTSEEEKEAVHIQNVIDVIQGEGLMSVVKVICDWMICNSSVIMTCAQVGQFLCPHDLQMRDMLLFCLSLFVFTLSVTNLNKCHIILT